MTRIQIEITLGIIMVMITSGVLIYIGLNEESRMARFDLAQQAQAIEVGASLYEINCSTCHGLKGEGIEGLCPPLNDQHFFNGRLAEIGWGSTQEDYIISTISTGRLMSTRPEQYVGGGTPAMPAWSEHYGGPLRDDQIQDIAAFVMNWESTAGQVTGPVVSGEPVGSDITVELPEGDAARGERLATTEGCAACHVSTPTGPAWQASETEPGIGSRAETRIAQPDYTGSAGDAHQYLFESIVLPHEFLVEGYDAIMPNSYADSLSPQEVADLIAYMLSLR